jgi:hypothetical protein
MTHLESVIGTKEEEEERRRKNEAGNACGELKIKSCDVVIQTGFWLAGAL